jgi:hypothetical protein
LYDRLYIHITYTGGDSKLAKRNKEVVSMGIGVGIFLIAVGAVLAFAVHATTSGVDLHTVGYILMGVGGLGILLSLIFWSSWGGPFRRTDVTTINDRQL